MHRNLAVNTQREIASFTELDAIPGLSIINTYDQRMIDFVSENRKIATGKMKNSLENIQNYVQTKISFNNGGSYSHIKPP